MTKENQVTARAITSIQRRLKTDTGHAIQSRGWSQDQTISPSERSPAEATPSTPADTPSRPRRIQRFSAALSGWSTISSSILVLFSLPFLSSSFSHHLPSFVFIVHPFVLFFFLFSLFSFFHYLSTLHYTRPGIFDALLISSPS